MFPYCSIKKSCPIQKKDKFTDFYHMFSSLRYKKCSWDKDTFYKNKLLVPPTPCFEQFVMHKLLNNKKPITNKLQQEEIKSILNEYHDILDFPENIKIQFVGEGNKVLQSFYLIEKDKIIQELIDDWDECNKNAEIVSFLMEWYREEKTEWLLKLIKIFILGMVPDRNKRKRGEAFKNMVYEHFYSLTSRFT